MKRWAAFILILFELRTDTYAYVVYSYVLQKTK